MKMRWLLSCVALLLSAGIVSADKRPRLPTMSDLATVWVGEAAPTSLEYFRLELRPGGSGVLTVQYLSDTPAVAYRVMSTTLDSYRIDFRLDPIDLESEAIEVSGEMGIRLRLNVRARNGKWRRLVTLTPAEALIKRIGAVSARAEEYFRDRANR